MKIESSRIKVIIEERSDAIFVYNKFIFSFMKKNHPDVDVITLNNRRFNNKILNFVLEIFNTLRIPFFTRNADSVLFTDPLPLNFLSTLFIRKKKFLIFFHYEKDPSYYRFLPRGLFRKVLASLDGIVCSSEYSLEQICLLGVDVKKCSIVYCGVDHTIFFPSLKSEKYPNDYILSVGSEEPRKNMKNILEAFCILKKKYPNMKLLKVGKASPLNRKNTLTLLERLNLSNDVVFTDYVDEKELPSIYSGANLLLFPSLLEGFGLPIVEAMACGCPVVTSNRNPMKELVGQGIRTVNPLDPNSIADFCMEILDNSRLREEMISIGLRRSKDFNWEMASEEIYSFLLENK